MAVTAPTPPTPPAAPVVPKVTMSDGGSVTMTSQPVSGKQSVAQLQENQARQAVARGDGALAKTTQEKPANNSETAAEKPTGQATANDSRATNTAQPQVNVGDEKSNAANTNTSETQTAQPQIPPSPKYHDGFYWLGLIAVSVVIAVAAWHYFSKARSKDDRISFNDINDIPKSANSEVVSDKYNGMTAEDVMQQLAAESQQGRNNKTSAADKHFEVTI